MDLRNYNIAILLPCSNEEQYISKTVINFRQALPSARIYVYYNNSSDNTAQQAALAGATVIPCPRDDKGGVIRQMFSDLEADIYVLATGDGAYDAEAAPYLVRKLLNERLDMVVGTRNPAAQKGDSRVNRAYNSPLFKKFYRSAFKREFTDIFSSYRVFTRRFAKSFPAECPGFDIETEMSIHASILKLPVAEIECHYVSREAAVDRSMSFIRNGIRLFKMMAVMLKETRPFAFFTLLAAAQFFASLFFALPSLYTFLSTGQASLVLIVSIGVPLIISAVVTLCTGMILDSVARNRTEQKRNFYLSIPASRGEKYIPGARMSIERRGTVGNSLGIENRKNYRQMRDY